jgi:hypothetical protein
MQSDEALKTPVNEGYRDLTSTTKLQPGSPPSDHQKEVALYAACGVQLNGW